MRPHLRDIPIPRLASAFQAAGVEGAARAAHRAAVAMHQHGARTWEALPVGRVTRERLAAHYDFGPLLTVDEVHTAEDETKKLLLGLRSGEQVEVVLLRNAKALTACLSSQAGCALGCTFCATGTLGLSRHLTAGEITESALLAQREARRRVTDVVFMGQGEPLHAYDAVMDACTNIHAEAGMSISKRRITISTSGLTPQIRRYADEGRPWRLHLSLHSAIQETREQMMPIAKQHPLPELIEAMRAYQETAGRKWVTLQYVAIPDVNMDERHVDALGTALRGLRYILNVIPYNDVGMGFRPPTWTEVKRFTTALRRLRCPVKIRYSGGKREGMGCGQLAAGRLPVTPAGGHVDAPPGIFTGPTG